MKKLLAVLTLLVASIPCSAACHVVLQGGTGTKSGADWNNAFSDLPATLVRGDSYYVAKGAYGKHTFKDADSGTTPITVAAVTATDHCTDTGFSPATMIGQAVFSCASACNQQIFEFTTDYYTITGQYRSTATNNPAVDWTTGYGFKLDNGNANANGGVGGGLGFGGSPVFVHDISVSFFEHNGIHPTSDATLTASGGTDLGVDFEGGSHHITISSSYIHDLWVPFFMRGSHGTGSHPGFGSGDSNTIDRNYVAHNLSTSLNHSEGCSCSEGLTNFTISHNYFVDMVGTAYIATPSGASAASGNGPNGPWNVFGNVFMSTSAGRAALHCGTGDGMLTIFDATFTGDVFFLNNTIANMSGCQADSNGITLGLGFTTPMQRLIVEDNLWFNDDFVDVINTGTLSFSGATLTATSWDHNSYYKMANPNFSTDNDANAVCQASTVANATIKCPFGSTNPFVDSTNSDFNLSADFAPGVNTGTTLAANNVDLNGVTRGSDGVWSRGAFQRVSAVVINPPTNLTATPH
jgi:hypothetical protein